MGERRRPRRRRIGWGLERLESRSMLAAVSGSVQRSIDVIGLAPDSPLFGGVPQVTVQLRDAGGGLIAQQVTDSSGNFSFAGVTAGRRSLGVVLPAGFMGTSSQSLSYDLTVASADVAGLTFALAARNQAIVQNLYELVLQRPATADEFTAAVGRLDASQPVANELGRLLRSTEFATVVQPVAGFVQAMFPGVLEIEFVRASGQQQRVGTTAAATLQGIMASQRFVTAHGDTSGLSNGDYVRFLYRQLLGRSPAAGPFRAAVNRLAAGTSRGQIALDLVNTAAFQARSQVQKSMRAAVTYAGMLGRDATAAEVRSFAAGPGNAVQLAGQLARSTEFRTLSGYTSTASWDVQAMAAALAPAATPLSRLQRYDPAKKSFDLAVEAGSLASTQSSPTNVYFISHGWAPGQTEAVLLGSTPGDPLKSWAAKPAIPPWLFQPTEQVSSESMAQAIVDADPNAIVVAYSWVDLSATPTPPTIPQVTVTLPATGQPAAQGAPQLLTVGDTSQLCAGMAVTGTGIPLQTKVSHVVSATQVAISNRLTTAITSAPVTFAGGDLEVLIRSLLYVGQSESRTQWAGLMFAEAIRQALAPDFFGANQGLVHVMGHSHGAKVATVATVALEAANVPVSQLTLFESPETGPDILLPLALPGIGGGQNFVWRFLQELPLISRTPVAVGRQATGGTFVDNYYSQMGFGEAVGGYAGLGSVVDVLLHPEALYNPSGDLPGDFGAMFPSHSYPPAWYAQASLQNPTASVPAPATVTNGLFWSPLLAPGAATNLQRSYKQYTPSSFGPDDFVQRQFELAPSTPPANVSVTPVPLVYATQPTLGTVTDNGSSLTLGIGSGQALSSATISFQPYGAEPNTPRISTGLELDVAFSGVDAGETVQLVVSVHGMAVPQLKIPGQNPPQPFFLTGSTGLMTIPLLTLDGGTSGPGPRMSTISLDVFRRSDIVIGAFASAANPVPQLVFSLIGSAGATATATVTNMRQFGERLPL